MICYSLWKAGTLEAFGNSLDVIKKTHLFIYFILQRCDLHTKALLFNVPLLVSSHSGRYNLLYCWVEVEFLGITYISKPQQIQPNLRLKVCGHLSITPLNNSSTSHFKTMGTHNLLPTLLGILAVCRDPIKMMKKTHIQEPRQMGAGSKKDKVEREHALLVLKMATLCIYQKSEEEASTQNVSSIKILITALLVCGPFVPFLPYFLPSCHKRICEVQH